MKAIKRSLVLVALAILPLTGCISTGGGVVIHTPGPATHHDLPPSHAPAHGLRAQQRYQYQYFPDAQVYFDLNRKLYFYISANRWKVGVSLPSYLRGRLGEAYVRLEMESEHPYQGFHEHKKKYPPGQLKKKNKGKDKHKNGKGLERDNKTGERE